MVHSLPPTRTPMSLTKGITVDIATPDFGLRDGPNTIGMKATPCTRCHLPRIPLNQDFKQCPDCRNKARLACETYRKRKLSDKRGRVTLNQGNSTPQNRTDTQPSTKLLKRPLEGKDSEKAAKRSRHSTAEGGVNAKDWVQNVPSTSSSTRTVSTTPAGSSNHRQYQAGSPEGGVNSKYRVQDSSSSTTRTISRTLAGPSNHPQYQASVTKGRVNTNDRAKDVSSSSSTTKAISRTLAGPPTHPQNQIPQGPPLTMPPRNPYLHGEHVRFPSTTQFPSPQVYTTPPISQQNPPNATPHVTQSSTHTLLQLDTLTPSPFRSHLTPKERQRLSVEFQTSAELYALLKVSISSSKPDQKSQFRLQFSGHYSIVANPVINNRERARLVVKDLRDVAGLSFVKASTTSTGRKRGKVSLKYACACLPPPDCSGAVIVRVEGDDSHPIEAIKGQKIWVEINHW